MTVFVENMCCPSLWEGNTFQLHHVRLDRMTFFCQENVGEIENCHFKPESLRATMSLNHSLFPSLPLGRRIPDGGCSFKFGSQNKEDAEHSHSPLTMNMNISEQLLLLRAIQVWGLFLIVAVSREIWLIWKWVPPLKKELKYVALAFGPHSEGWWNWGNVFCHYSSSLCKTTTYNNSEAK